MGKRDFQNNLTTLARRLRPFLYAAIAASPASSAVLLNRIILMPSGTGDPSVYPKTDAGLTAAIAASSSGDAIFIPPGTISGTSWTNKSGVTMTGYGDRTILAGALTNNGTVDRLTCSGAITNVGLLIRVRSTPSTGTGITQSSGGVIDKCWVQMGTGVTYGIDISDGYIFHSVVGTNGGTTNTGVYIHGATVEINHCRFGGNVGGKIEQAYSVSNCTFYGADAMPSTISHGAVHATTGTVYLANCSFLASSADSYGLVVSDTGLTLTDCNWDEISGQSNITYGTGDRAPDNHTHAGGGGSATDLFAPFTIAADGAWTWFIDPRAFYYNGKTYLGYIDSVGDIEVRSFDHSTHAVSSAVVLHAALEVDDHDNPSLLMRDSDKKILAFYSAHLGATIYSRLSSNAEDVSSFAAEVSLDSSLGGVLYTYPNPVQLLGETNDPIYLFFRHHTPTSGDYPHWAFSKSTDNGATFGALTNFVAPVGNRSPYLRIVQNGDDRVDFAMSNSHPNEAAASVYHFYYQGDNWYKTDGTLIGGVGALPLDSGDMTLVYDGTTNDGWVWDIAIDPDGQPLITFTKFISTTDHRYMYAKWSGSAWVVNQIVEGGTYLYAGEPYYSGGVVLDHTDPSIVYLSKVVASQWEIYRYVTPDGGATWTSQAVTDGSASKNIRPVAIRNHPPGYPALYLSGTYTSYTNYNLAVKMIYADVDDGDERVKVSENDTTAGYLNGKLVAGTNITLTEGNDGGDETLTISETAAIVKVSANDTTAGYLNGKLIEGAGIDFTENSDGSNETLTIASSYEVLMADGEATATPLANDEDSDWLYSE